jgi:predicted GNAT family acetyltransferase
MTHTVRDNPGKNRFELELDGQVAFSEYTRDGATLTIRHTEVPRALGGKGVGSALVGGLLELVRAQGLKVRARCPFVAGYMDKHPEYADLRV